MLMINKKMAGCEVTCSVAPHRVIKTFFATILKLFYKHCNVFKNLQKPEKLIHVASAIK